MTMNSAPSQPRGARMFRRLLLCGTSLALLAAAPQGALAQQNDTIEEIRVVEDPVGLLEERQSSTLFGFDKSILETPRAVSVVSETTIDRYAIEDIDDFITTTPGTFGGAFFGLPGAITIRGDVTETYFRGFRKVRNDGLFPTPVGASDRVEIVRGIVPVTYGAGRIGGLLNLQPKTVLGQQVTTADGPTGGAEFTVGSFEKYEFAGEVAIPFELGSRESGVATYIEYENSGSYYYGREPEQFLIQATANHELGSGLSLEFGGQYQNSEGYLQTPGYNRLTQDLVDNGIYITGNDTDLTDTNGNGYLDKAEVDAAVGTAFFGTISNIRSFIDPAFGFLPNPGGEFGQPRPDIAAAFQLDENVGTTELGRREVFIGPDDVQDASNITIYADLVYEFEDDSTAKLQFFLDDLEADLSVGYGFASRTDSQILELRGTYDTQLELDENLTIGVLGTANYQRNKVSLSEYFLSGYLVLDRADISDGVQGFETFATPINDSNTPFDSVFDSTWENIGVSMVTDWQIAQQFQIIAGFRYDHYTGDATDTGITNFGTPTEGSASEGDVTYSVSASWNSEFGVVPYFTYAKANQRLDNVAGGFNPGQLESTADQFVSDSELIEVGLKWSLFDERLIGSFAYYEMERDQVDPVNQNILGEEAEGFEVELNFIPTDNWAFTAAATFQEFNIKAPQVPGVGEFVVVSPTNPLAVAAQPDTNTSNADSYGGLFAALNAGSLPELVNGYQRTVIPDTVISAFVTYTSDETDLGTFGATFGGTYVDETMGKTIGSVTFPDYILLRAAAFAEYGPLSIIATVENLTDKRYFQPLQNVYEEVAAIPGEGRNFRITLRYNF